MQGPYNISSWQLRCNFNIEVIVRTVYPKKYVRCFCFAVLCCGYTLTGLPIPIRLTSLALWQSNDCPSASKATLMNMGKFIMRSHYERLPNSNKAKHNKTVCIFLGIYCIGTGMILTKEESICDTRFPPCGRLSSLWRGTVISLIYIILRLSALIPGVHLSEAHMLS